MKVLWTYKEHASGLSALLRLADVSLVLVGALGAYAWYLATWPMAAHYQAALVVGVLLVLAMFPAFGVYRFPRAASLLGELRRLTVAWTATVSAMLVLVFMTKTGWHFSRVWTGTWALSAWGGMVAVRLAVHVGMRRRLRHGHNARRIVVVAEGDFSKEVVRRVATAPRSAMKIIAVYQRNGSHDVPLKGIETKQDISDLSEFVRERRADEVWLALPFSAEHLIKRVLHELRHDTVAVRLVPDIHGIRLINHSITEILGLPVLNLTESPMTGINVMVKTALDTVLSATVLVLASPLLMAVAVAIKLTSPGPVFYRQERVSWNGKPFVMFKFRTMPVGSEKASGPVWSRATDDRATRVGRLLRRTSLDELPQFINVLKGEMSIVGPRPERPYFIEKFKEQIPDYMQKHLVKAGITGWAQVNGWRGDTDLSKRIEYDLYYIEHWSVWFDLKIMWLTLAKGFLHKNAH